VNSANRPYFDSKTASTIASIVHSKLDCCNSLCITIFRKPHPADSELSCNTVVETLSITHPQISVVEASKLFFKFYFLFCFLVFLATLAFCMLLLFWIVISAIGE